MLDRIEQKIVEIIDKKAEEIMAFGTDVWNHAELGYKEVRTSGKFVEEMAKLGLESETASSYFHDVFDSDWFYPYISVAFEKGIVKGDNLGLFGVNAGITREDATVIASRVLKLMGKSTEATRAYADFADEATIADYAKEAVRELYCMGRMNGTNEGKFEPQRFCTRAEAAMIIYNISR